MNTLYHIIYSTSTNFKKLILKIQQKNPRMDNIEF